MKKLVIILGLILFAFFGRANHALAVENPLSKPNNKVGIHILFPYEAQLASTVVNSNGGDWGYVTIPIQSGDKNTDKWQAFFDDCKKYHVIPIIRLATEGDYFNTTVWRKPNYYDIIDFANFLNSLSWPTKNRYIVIFNEPNDGQEWGGKPNASEYADLLSFAVTIFKTRSPDFFVISAGLDNAAANTSTAMNEYLFIRGMEQEIPGIFNQIDGIGSHSYPNPAFVQSPYLVSNETITSFRYESSLIESYASKQLPIFITETGWTRDRLSDNTIAGYYTNAYKNVWNDPRIVAVTPFLLEAGGAPFSQFSVMTSDGKQTAVSQAIENIAKTKGEPDLNPVLSAETISESRNLQPEDFSKEKSKKEIKLPDKMFQNIFNTVAKYLLHI